MNDDTSHTGRLIRPYAMTGGRTGADVAEISLEAQLQASRDAVPEGKVYRWESAKILALAEHPTALIELAARAEVPIGVVRVIVADLIEDGAIIVRVTPIAPHASLLERVLDGLLEI